MAVPGLLLTGFSIFPGALVNPTEALVQELRRNPGDFTNRCDFRAAVLDVNHASIGDQLAELAEQSEPDIAIHFGLANEATGFRLERFGRNIAARNQPDNHGATSTGFVLESGPDQLETTLPRAEIAFALQSAGLPVMLDDQAGDYLCNAVFYLSRSGTCGRFCPQMSGFIHVPQLPVDDGGMPGDGERLPLNDLVQGARLAITTCLDVWESKKAAT
jgi:pyroglutamyl-peptidase